jgi:hypothetical protein
MWVVVYLGQYLQTRLLGYYKQSALGLGNRIALPFGGIIDLAIGA